MPVSHPTALAWHSCSRHPLLYIIKNSSILWPCEFCLPEFPALLTERWTCDWKVASSNPGRSSRRIFFSRVNFVCWLIQCPFHPSVTAMAHKRSWSFCQKCSSRLHLKAHTSLTQRSWSGLTTVSGNKLTHNSSRNTQLELSHSARWAILDLSWLNEWN